MDIEYRDYEEGDEEQIVELLVGAFGDWPMADIPCSKTDYWRWKYIESPYSGNGILVKVATVGEEVIGVCSTIVLPFQFAGNQTYITYAGDHAVKKEYRRRGISSRLIDENRMKRDAHGIKYSYFVTQNPYLIQAYDKRYHVFPLSIINMARIQDVDLQLRKMPMEYEWLIKTGYKALQVTNRLKYSIKNDQISEVEIEQVKSFPEDIDSLLESQRKLRFMINNKREYLNWRYCDPRAGPFKILLARHNETPIGYIVTRINKYLENYPIGYIVDLLTDEKNDPARLLLEEALNEMDEENINIVLSMIPKGHRYERLYGGNGFVDSRKNLHLYTTLNRYDEEYLIQDIKPSEVHFNYGAIDSLPTSIPTN